MMTFAIDYFMLVFIASLGMLQISASFGRLKGLLIFKSRPIAIGMGLVLIGSSFVIFFNTGSRNINDFEGGLDAPTQGLFFFLGAFAGIVITFMLSSLLNWRMGSRIFVSEPGLEVLRQTNYINALRLSCRYWSKHWRTQMRSYFFG